MLRSIRATSRVLYQLRHGSAITIRNRHARTVYARFNDFDAADKNGPNKPTARNKYIFVEPEVTGASCEIGVLGIQHDDAYPVDFGRELPASRPPWQSHVNKTPVAPAESLCNPWTAIARVRRPSRPVRAIRPVDCILDADPVPPHLRQQAISEYNRLRSLEDEEGTGEPRLGEPQLSFQLAQSLDMTHRQALLVMRSETERLTYLVQSLPSYITRKQQVALARRLAPRNGHARQYTEES